MNSFNDKEKQQSGDQVKEAATYTYGPNQSAMDMKSNYEKQLELLQASGYLQEKPGEDNNEPKHNGRRKRKGSPTAMLAAFLVGAVVIGGFMYTADRNNLFTGGTETASVTHVADKGSSGAGVKTASTSVDQTISGIYAKASPAVVKIENYAAPKQPSGRDGGGWPFGGGIFGQDEGQGLNRQEEQGQQQGQGQGTDTSNLQLTGSGTGFIFDKAGYIVTNEHVVADAAQVKVTVQGHDEPFVATVVGADKDHDLAVLKIEGGGDLTTLPIGNSDESAIGDWVIAIGNPYGFDHTMTVGVLSAKERPITIADETGNHVYEHLLQTDASINPGNSGGPLLNAKGEVIGINTAVNSEAQGIGFAIPTSTIKDVLKTIMGNSIL
ncbi:S1C family serine protease [Paenibacillus gorillae]|uniref:S1C family serine protease n=1 Tax=Paenibacillus gorillae TaxID=1243662 RepID=UPI0004B18C0E|nr:trypsin-like peptidase domain-containing protein [Paenibacillus gorillae]